MNATSMTASPAWTAAGWTMLHLLWVGATIGLAAAISRRLARSARPETRYALALVCLGSLAIAAVMIFAWVFPPARGPAFVAASAGSGDALALSVVPMAKMPASELPSRMSVPDRPTDPYRRSSWAQLDGLAARLPWLWLAGTPLNLVLLSTGLVGVERIRRSSRFVESGEVPRRCRALADSLGIACRVGVAVCDRVAAPLLIGVVRPLILLPPAAITGWSVAEIEMALLHELAHLKRWDNLVNLLQRLLESLLFFHPVAWWLSGWVRLERELCCDRLVVARLGRPEAYVEMLVTVAGARRAGRHVAPATAMADRQLSTRIHRILSLEDRSMRLTMPEGIGLVCALIAGIGLALGTHAAPPKRAGESQESLRLALQTAAKDVLADPRPGADGGGLRFFALLSISESQLNLGDRAAALETLRRASEACERFDFKRNDWGDLEVFAILPEIAKQQREAGDLAAARVSLDRATKLVESLQGFTKVQELTQLTGAEAPRREKHEVGPLIRGELLEMIARERIALGDRDGARPLLQQSVAAIQSQKDELKPMALAGLAPKLFKAGEKAEARAMIDQARRAATELKDPEDREGAMAYVAVSMAESGDLDGALELTRTLGKYGRQSALRNIIESLADRHPQGAAFEWGGIRLLIGAGELELKEREAAQPELPRIAQVVRGIPDPLLQARTLSMIAHLQAKAGALAAARQTADSIPDLKRTDFPGPSDGFYDAIKPGTLAILAKLQADAGDRDAATQGLSRALVLSRAIDAADQKIVAQIIIAQNQLACGFRDEARNLVRETIAVALKQAEPLRSRGLAMLSELQGNVGELAAAARTVEAIRGYPPFEKERALQKLADGHTKAGDRRTAKRLIRQALDCVEAKEPENARAHMGKSRRLVTTAAGQFVDLECEFEPRWAEHQKLTHAVSLRAQLGEIDEAVRKARTLSAKQRSGLLSNFAAQLAREGDAAGAFRLAATIEDAEERLSAIATTANVIGDRQATK